MKKIIKLIIGLITLVCIIISIYSIKYTKTARVTFLSDTHAVVDTKDRDLNWNKNSFTRIKAIFANKNLQPSHIIWLGDIIDFMPEEWEIAKNWINWINSNSNVNQYAVMGNHDYLYYNYPEILGKFNAAKNNTNYLSYEIESLLNKTVYKGDTTIKVDNAKQFFIGSEILLIETPDFNTKNKFHLSIVKNIDISTNTIELYDRTPDNFEIENTSVRQGFTEKRGINYFLDAFKNTTTKSTKNIFFIGNNCFILMSMDNYFKRDLNAKNRAIPETDFKWFEDQLINYEKTHNIIVVMHELPESGKNLGNIYDPNDVIDYDSYTREKFMSLVNKYNITAWVSGHNHPDIRKNNISYKHNNTTFLVSPSLGTNAEGQVLKLELENDAKLLRFEYWSIDKNEIIKQVSVQSKKLDLN